MNQWLFVLYVGFSAYGSVMPSVHYMTDKIPKCYYRVLLLQDRGHMRHALLQKLHLQTPKRTRYPGNSMFHIKKYMQIHNNYHMAVKMI